MHIVDAHRYRPCKYEGISPRVGLDIPSNLGHIYGKSLNSEGNFPMLGGVGLQARSPKVLEIAGLILSGCNVIGWSYVINILPRFGYVGGGHSGPSNLKNIIYFLNV